MKQEQMTITSYIVSILFVLAALAFLFITVTSITFAATFRTATPGGFITQPGSPVSSPTTTATPGSATNSPSPEATPPDFGVLQMEETTASPPSEINDVQIETFSGEVQRRDGSVLTVRTDEGTKQVTVPAGVNISRNTQEATIDEIMPNDRVSITQTSDGQVLAVDATVGEVFDIGKWALPLLGIGLLTAIILWMLLRRANRSHIKTTGE